MFDRIHMHDSLDAVLVRISHADSDMLLRELMQNAIEAARFADSPRVELRRTDDDQLVIWNNGKGMTASEMESVLGNLGMSGDEKELRRGGNFGQGCKLTILHTYHGGPGAVYRSCNGGVVTACQLGWEDGVPKLFDMGDGSKTADVTRGYTDGQTAFDWTEVQLLGLHDGHATADTPFALDEKVPSYFFSKHLCRRFYDLTSNMYVKDEASRGNRPGVVRGIAHQEFEKFECVEVSSDINIMYGIIQHDQKNPDKWSGRKQRGVGSNHACLIYKNELYEGHFDREWTAKAHRFGFSGLTSQVAVQVIIKNESYYQPDDQRKRLNIEEGSKKTQVTVETFDQVIRDNIPAWLQERLDAALGDVSGKKIKSELKKLEREYNAYLSGNGTRLSPKVKRKSKSKVCPRCTKLTCVCPRCEDCNRKLHQCICGRVERGPNNESGTNDDTDSLSQKGDDSRSISCPDPVWIDTDHSEFDNVDGYIAAWKGEFIWLNSRHDVIDSAAKRLMQERGTKSVTDKNTATELVMHHIALAAAKFVMNAQSQSMNGWSVADIENATNSNALTAAIADTLVIADATRRQFATKAEN